MKPKTFNRPGCPTCKGEGVLIGPGNVTVPCSNPTCQCCKQPSTIPELDKMHAVKDKLQACGEFVEWLSSKGIVLASYHEHTVACYADDEQNGYDYGDQMCQMSTETLRHDHRGINKLLAEFFEVDLDKAEADKVVLLDEIRKANGGGK